MLTASNKLFFIALAKVVFSNGRFSSFNSIKVDLTVVLAVPSPIYSLPSLVILTLIMVSFLIAVKGPIAIPVVGASIENTSTVIGEPSLQIVNFSETQSSQSLQRL